MKYFLKFVKNKKIKIIFVIFIGIILLFCTYYQYKKYNYLNLEKQELSYLNKKNIKEINKLKLEEQKQKKFLKNIDLNTDSSITKYVSAKIPFNKKDYIPNNLINISTGFIVDGKGGGQKLRKEALLSLKEMAKDYYRDTGKKIVVVSAYRSYLYQKGIKDRGCPDNLCAKAGYSEHQTGLAVDLWAASSNGAWQSKIFKQRYNWLKENAYKYGFHNTYQKGLEVDTYEVEPWHWRYLGKSLAKYLWENNLTFAEFYNKIEQH